MSSIVYIADSSGSRAAPDRSVDFLLIVEKVGAAAGEGLGKLRG
jgi:hypothetical protein